MNRKWMHVMLAVAVAVPAGLTAQGNPRPAPAPRARASSPYKMFTYIGNRGRIGVIVNTRADADSDKIGARIDAVTPGGPAAKAGLKAGDLITRFNGTSLAGVRTEEGDEEESGPGMKLIELAHELDPGDTVQVEYRRGAESKKATLVAAEVESGGVISGNNPWFPTAPGVALTIPDMRVEPGMTTGFAFCFGDDGWCNLDLVRLNADLGEYFGTSEGLLVVKAPADSALPLKSGDVILSIGGRKPTSTEQAMRILRSYDVGETVSVEIMRKQKRLTVAWKVPEREGMLRTRIPRRRENGEPSIYRVVPKVRIPALALRASERAVKRMKVRINPLASRQSI